MPGSGIPGRRPEQLISARDRELAVEELTSFMERGFIKPDDLAQRTEIVEEATTAREIKSQLTDLRDARRRDDEVRARKDERDAAERRLKLHAEAGELKPEELERRLKLLRTAVTRGEIAETLTELEPIKLDRLPAGARLATTAQRKDAADELKHHREQGRLTTNKELGERLDIVENARTPDEIANAFSGLDRRPWQMRRRIDEVEKAGRSVIASATPAIKQGSTVVRHTGKKAKDGLIFFVWAFVSVIAVIAATAKLATGNHNPAVPLVILVLVTLAANRPLRARLARSRPQASAPADTES